MKLIALFLVLSMVVLMAEPGDAFIHHIFSGLVHVGKTIHGLIHGGYRQQREQQDQRLFDRERAFE